MAFYMSIRRLDDKEISEVLSLVWSVFLKYEAPDYSEEGVKEFYKSIHDQSYLSKLSIYGAFKKQKLVGVIATRSQGSHIALFFVDGKYHRQGIGTELLLEIEKKYPAQRYELFTSTESIHNIAMYQKLGYKIFDEKQITDGLRYVYLEKRFY